MKAFSSSWKVLGDMGEEHDRMKRILGICEGSGFLSKIRWIVGTAVYQLALYVIKLSQNSEAENFIGIITEPPENRGARRPASNPCTWKRGMTKSVRSSDVSLYVNWMFSICISFVLSSKSRHTNSLSS